LDSASYILSGCTVKKMTKKMEDWK
jgi:hypothetical protein